MKMITKLFGCIYVIKFFFCCFNKIIKTLFFQPRPTPLLLIIITMSIPRPLLFQPLLLFGAREYLNEPIKNDEQVKFVNQSIQRRAHDRKGKDNNKGQKK